MKLAYELTEYANQYLRGTFAGTLMHRAVTRIEALEDELDRLKAVVGDVDYNLIETLLDDEP